MGLMGHMDQWVSGKDALQDTKRNLRMPSTKHCFSLRAPEVALLAIFFWPLFFICVNLRASAVRLCFHSRHFAACRAVGLAEADPFAVSLVFFSVAFICGSRFIGAE
jgi:hypothetical protein